MGASSGIGREVALLLLADGWQLGLSARRIEPLLEIKTLAPERVEVMAIDVTQPDARDLLLTLIQRMDGIDLYFHASGIGHQNRTLVPDIEMRTMDTNAIGFTRMIGHGLQILCRTWRRPYRRHHLHCRHQGTGTRSSLFSHQSPAIHLPSGLGATGTSTESSHPHH